MCHIFNLNGDEATGACIFSDAARVCVRFRTYFTYGRKLTFFSLPAQPSNKNPKNTQLLLRGCLPAGISGGECRKCLERLRTCSVPACWPCPRPASQEQEILSSQSHRPSPEKPLPLTLRPWEPASLVLLAQGATKDPPADHRVPSSLGRRPGGD